MPTPSVESEAQAILRSLDEISFPVIIITAIATWIVVFGSERAIPWLAARLPERYRFYILPLAPIIRLLVLGVALLHISLQIIRPSTQNLIAIAGGSALALGFAFKDYASSIIAGIVALYEQPYRTGDWVRIGSDYGEVKSVGLRAIKIVTLDDDTVSVPHLNIWTNNITNANSGEREHQCVAEYFLAPAHDAMIARRTLMDVALTSPYIQLQLPISVVVIEQPWATRYRLKAYPLDGKRQVSFTTDLTVRGKQALHQLGIAPASIHPETMLAAMRP
jgi:small conductance mechanosensitive channel